MTDEKPPGSEPQQKGLFERFGQFLTGEPQNQEELLEVLKEAKENGVLDAGALSMIEGILRFSSMRVRDIMIPRIQMKVIPKAAKVESIIPLVLEHGHSRFPVIEDDRSKVVGVLLAKDILAAVAENKQNIVEDLMRPVSIVPESKRLNVLLNEFRKERDHMAIVVDEYGMAAGLVTIEDVLEQIVGEIEDEYDSKGEGYVDKCSKNRYTLKALMPIDEFNEFFSASLTDDEHETIGGFVVHQFGYMPKKGERLKYDKFCFDVLHADNRRVFLLKLKVLKNEKQDVIKQ